MTFYFNLSMFLSLGFFMVSAFCMVIYFKRGDINQKHWSFKIGYGTIKVALSLILILVTVLSLSVIMGWF